MLAKGRDLQHLVFMTADLNIRKLTCSIGKPRPHNNSGQSDTQQHLFIFIWNILASRRAQKPFLLRFSHYQNQQVTLSPPSFIRQINCARDATTHRKVGSTDCTTSRVGFKSTNMDIIDVKREKLVQSPPTEASSSPPLVPLAIAIDSCVKNDVRYSSSRAK